MITCPLYLASQSPTRAALMDQWGVSYALMIQQADESCVGTQSDSLVDRVRAIATHKMDHLDRVHMPDTGCWYVITADTLCQSPEGHFLGKPRDYAHALKMIECQSGRWIEVATGVCVRKYSRDRELCEIKTVCTAVVSRVLMDIAPHERARYIEFTHAMRAAGAMVIDGYGASFVQAIEGSYTNILGLPLYETKKLLQQLD